MEYIKYDNDGIIRHCDCRYVDLDGNPIERTREEYPYSYDAYVTWKGNYNRNDEQGSGVYSDRLYQWDSKKYNECCKAIWGNEGQYFNNRSPESIEKFLSKYFDYKIELTAILEGCNMSSGYPYWVFCFRKL